MGRPRIACAIRAMTVLLLLLQTSAASAMQSVTIVADDSIHLVVTQLAKEYARKYNVSVNTSFQPKDLLTKQLLEGGEADILMTMDSKWIAALKLQGLLDIYSQAPFGRGQLALIGPTSSTLNFLEGKPFTSAPLIQALQQESVFYIGNPEFVPEGKQSKELLRTLNVADALEPYTLYVKDTNEILEEVRKNSAYGLFLYSEIKADGRVKILNVPPKNNYSPMDYYAVVVAGEQMDEARNFLKFLKTTEAKNIIKTQGLMVD